MIEHSPQNPRKRGKGHHHRPHCSSSLWRETYRSSDVADRFLIAMVPWRLLLNVTVTRLTFSSFSIVLFIDVVNSCRVWIDVQFVADACRSHHNCSGLRFISSKLRQHPPPPHTHTSPPLITITTTTYRVYFCNIFVYVIVPKIFPWKIPKLATTVALPCKPEMDFLKLPWVL